MKKTSQRMSSKRDRRSLNGSDSVKKKLIEFKKCGKRNLVWPITHHLYLHLQVRTITKRKHQQSLKKTTKSLISSLKTSTREQANLKQPRVTQMSNLKKMS